MKYEKDKNQKAPFPYIMDGKLRPIATLNGKEYLYFAGTGYFQLQSDSEVIEQAVAATRKYGISSATSRTINGTTPLILKLEKRIADFFYAEDAAYLPSGYLSNMAGFQALDAMGVFDVIFIDESSHYSNIGGALATGKKVVKFKHLDVKDLEKQIKKHLNEGKKPLIVSDGLFPIWAEIPPIPAYLKIAEQYDGAIWVDDAHGVGILGDHGRGVYDYFLLHSERLFMGATLSKAFGAYGGFVIGDSSFIHRIKSGNVMTGTSSPPSAMVGAALSGIEIVKNKPELLKRLRRNALYLKEKITETGISIDENYLPIVTFSIGNGEKMQNIQRLLMDNGIYIQYVKYIGSGIDGVLRIVVSSEHTMDEINFLVSSIGELL